MQTQSCNKIQDYSILTSSDTYLEPGCRGKSLGRGPDFSLFVQLLEVLPDQLENMVMVRMSWVFLRAFSQKTSIPKYLGASN